MQMLPPLLNITVASPMLDNFKLIPMSDVPTTNWEDISVGSQDLASRNQDNTSCALQLNRHIPKPCSSQYSKTLACLAPDRHTVPDFLVWQYNDTPNAIKVSCPIFWTINIHFQINLWKTQNALKNFYILCQWTIHQLHSNLIINYIVI